MTLWEKAKTELIDIIEWTDDSSDIMVWRFPRYENEIKHGAQLIVRQSQAAVFVNMGKIADVFTSGRYSLTTRNLPILSTLMGWKYGFQSPFRSEVYFVNTRNFTNLKWGTKNPIMLRDPEFGPVRLRSFGTYVVRVNDPAKFIREIVGTEGIFTLEEVSDQLRNLIVSRFADTIAGSKIPVLDLSANYNELSDFLAKKMTPEFLEYGLELTKLLIENISFPVEVEEALDKKSSMGVIGNLDSYMKFQSANAMESAAKNPGGEASAGVGMGMGFAMANQLGKMSSVLQERTDHPAPPPLSSGENEIKYYVGNNGKQSGPFNMDTVIEYIRNNAITKKTLMWKAGLEEWKPAEVFNEFKTVFETAPPPLPE
jgi:membrane protease subunit (stomatin/prohibitin family)